MDNTLYLVCVVTRGSSWRSATLAPSGGGGGAYNEANEGQAHHMLSRFLNLGFFFHEFFSIQGRLFLVRSKSTNKTVYHNRKIHFTHPYKQFKIEFRENI